MSEALTLSSTDGLTLEAVVDEPNEPSGVVVMCHPHPHDGGTMNAPLLLALKDALLTGSRAVLRFNFRGIGASEGSSGDGTDEVADALGAIEFARDRNPALPLALIGWSFGASVAIRSVPDAGNVSAVIAIAPPVSGRAGYSLGLPDRLETDVPLLVVAGANDTTTDPGKQRAWAEANNARFLALKGANHFFWAKYDDLAAEVTAFLNETS
ncbi:MAG: alpha/beta hydrolase [Actinomycetota bacterium]|nr:alpha/beta hydrolase [Actinomycetota bacterium]